MMGPSARGRRRAERHFLAGTGPLGGSKWINLTTMSSGTEPSGATPPAELLGRGTGMLETFLSLMPEAAVAIDGDGIIAALEAVDIIRKLGLHPRRTLRVVFWTNEENGTAGGNAYRAMVGGKIHDYVAAIEMDGGAEKPVGFGVTPGGPALARVKEIGQLLESIGAGNIHEGGGGTDIGPLMRDGVPGLGLETVEQHYFDWHHTRTDTVDKIDPREFRQCIAAMAVMGYVLADMPDRL